MPEETANRVAVFVVMPDGQRIRVRGTTVQECADVSAPYIAEGGVLQPVNVFAGRYVKLRSVGGLVPVTQTIEEWVASVASDLDIPLILAFSGND